MLAAHDLPLPPFFAPLRPPIPSVGKVEEERQRFSRNVGCRSTPPREEELLVRPFACAPTTEMDHDKSPRDCFHAENGTVSFPKGMHRKTFIIPGYVTGSRDAAIRFAANLTSFSKGIFSF